MPVVVKTPIIEYDCDHCGARSRAKEEEFKPIHTMPPLWEVPCGFCNLVVRVSPQPLVAKLVGNQF